MARFRNVGSGRGMRVQNPSTPKLLPPRMQPTIMAPPTNQFRLPPPQLQQVGRRVPMPAMPSQRPGQGQPPMAMQRPMAPPRPVSPPFLSPYEQQETMGRGGGPSPYGGGFGSFQQPSFGGGFGGPTYGQGYGMQGGIGSLLPNYPSYMPPRMPFNPYFPSGSRGFNSSPGKGMRPQPYGGAVRQPRQLPSPGSQQSLRRRY